MEYENRMEQHYAVSEKNVLVHITEAHKSSEDFFCPHCGCRMLKRCGNVRTWHFAHDYRYKNEVNKECSFESYLHAFTKLRFKQWFDNSKSIILYYQQTEVCRFAKNCIWRNNNDACCESNKMAIDIKKYLTHCKIEETVQVDGNIFRADLLWYNPQKQENNILIEIKVTHECSQKKRESGKRIIEFEVHSEEDVENIVANDIIESDSVKYYGFSPNDFINDNMPSKYSLLKFIYYNTRKAFVLRECNCKSYRKRRRNALLEISIKKSYSFGLGDFYSEWQSYPIESYLYNWGLAFTKSKGYDVRNCTLCKYRNYDSENERQMCKLLPNQPYTTNDAISCSNYVIDEEKYCKILNEFVEFSQNNLVDLWFKEDR